MGKGRWGAGGGVGRIFQALEIAGLLIIRVGEGRARSENKGYVWPKGRDSRE